MLHSDPATATSLTQNTSQTQPKNRIDGEKLKIVHFISSPASGGAEVYVKDLSIAMTKEGHDVHIIFLCSAAEIGRDLDFEKEFLGELKENSIEFHFIGRSARKNPIKGITRTRSILKTLKPDVVHCHLYYAAIFSLFASPKASQLIYTHHSIKLDAPKIIYKALDLRFIKYIGICSACQNMLQPLTRRETVRIDNAVNSLRVKVSQKKIPTEKGIVKIISVGRLSEAKNYPLLIKSLSKIKHLNFRLEIAGEGPERTKIEELIEELDLQDKVSLLGAVTDIPERLSNSDIFAMSSSWEGLPIALIEATLSGLPAIVTDVGGCSEVIQECRNGIIAPQQDEHNYSQGLKRLIESKNLRREYSENATKSSSRYEIKHSLKSHLSLYDSLLCT